MEAQDLYKVDDVEIFSVGKWNGREITSEDLDQIVEAYGQTKGTVTPSLKLGHDDDQKLLKSEGLPAAGWVDNVRRVGNKLVCDFVDIPKKIFQLIKNKAYRKVSVEIYNNIDIAGNKFPKLLGAVALLGAELPGVLNLRDILATYKVDQDFSWVQKFAVGIDPDIISTDTKQKKVKNMSEANETVKFQLEKVEGENKALAADVEKYKNDADALKGQLDAAQKEKEDLLKQVAEAKQKEKNATLDKFVSEISADKLCSKAMQPLVKELLSQEKETYSIDKKEYSKLDLVREILKYAVEASKVNFEEKTADAKDGDQIDSGKLEKYAAENKISVSQAYRQLNRKGA